VIKKACIAALLALTARAQSPVTKVVTLLNELEARIQGDGKVEQQSYDKTACWCEETMARKAKDIDDAKTKIEELQTLIEKLEGEVATHGAEVAQLKKDIAANQAAQKEATEVRQTGNSEYEATKTESEQCIGALEAAIKVLTPAGKAAGFLATSMQQANLLSVASSLRPVLSKYMAQDDKMMSESDMKAIRAFVERPADFIALQTKGASALQTGNNPFGDYAPQSTQIQGILKGLYDQFTQGLEKANGEESDAQKAYEELMATKQAELETLQATLQKQEQDFAEKDKTKAESKTLRDDTMEQLAADEKFFEETKDSCKALANDWATRSRLRTEELQGISVAKGILNSPEAQAIFANASTTLLQTSSKVAVRAHGRVAAAAATLRQLSKTTPANSMALSQLADQAEAGGNKAFDKVIVAIDQMIADLRKEEEEDIAHRDRCQTARNKNANDKEDLNHKIETTDAEIEKLQTAEMDLKRQITNLEETVAATTAEMEEMLKLRNKAEKEFKAALLADTQAVDLLSAALVALTKFYQKNKAFVQQPDDVEYSIDKDKMPKTTWQEKGEGKNYGGRKGDSQPIISMISAIKEDMINEMKVAREEEAAAQAEFVKQRDSMQASLDADTKSKVATEKELSETLQSIADKQDFKARRQADLQAQEDLAITIGTDCSWVETHFESRRTARKTEISGLEEAKNYLAGSEDPLE